MAESDDVEVIDEAVSDDSESIESGFAPIVRAPAPVTVASVTPVATSPGHGPAPRPFSWSGRASPASGPVVPPLPALPPPSSAALTPSATPPAPAVAAAPGSLRSSAGSAAPAVAAGPGSLRSSPGSAAPALRPASPKPASIQTTEPAKAPPVSAPSAASAAPPSAAVPSGTAPTPMSAGSSDAALPTAAPNAGASATAATASSADELLSEEEDVDEYEEEPPSDNDATAATGHKDVPATHGLKAADADKKPKKKAGKGAKGAKKGKKKSAGPAAPLSPAAAMAAKLAAVLAGTDSSPTGPARDASSSAKSAFPTQGWDGYSRPHRPRVNTSLQPASSHSTAATHDTGSPSAAGLPPIFSDSPTSLSGFNSPFRHAAAATSPTRSRPATRTGSPPSATYTSLSHGDDRPPFVVRGPGSSPGFSRHRTPYVPPPVPPPPPPPNEEPESIPDPNIVIEDERVIRDRTVSQLEKHEEQLSRVPTLESRFNDLEDTNRRLLVRETENEYRLENLHEQITAHRDLLETVTGEIGRIGSLAEQQIQQQIAAQNERISALEARFEARLQEQSEEFAARLAEIQELLHTKVAEHDFVISRLQREQSVELDRYNRRLQQVSSVVSHVGQSQLVGFSQLMASLDNDLASLGSPRASAKPVLKPLSPEPPRRSDSYAQLVAGMGTARPQSPQTPSGSLNGHAAFAAKLAPVVAGSSPPTVGFGGAGAQLPAGSSPRVTSPRTGKTTSPGQSPRAGRAARPILPSESDLSGLSAAEQLELLFTIRDSTRDPAVRKLIQPQIGRIIANMPDDLVGQLRFGKK